ncbi:NAD(P)/FAD-dependent oxidoreductase [Nocardioides panacihumi]|uniref:NAD(P)/FAD-dependent oxidoreductase n=1 Tax=Nocardioides panacihumi TaxID=400774 RepID=A0ABN2R7I2_9ACTN
MVVVGAGQAGLAVSNALETRGVEHVVLEAERIASSWRGRWDGFTLVTPNWTLALPGAPYDGDDPEGHVGRDLIVDYLEAYADAHAGEIRAGVRVERITAGHAGRFLLDTSEGPLTCDRVVVCTGAYRRVHRPSVAGALPAHVTVLDTTSYRAPGDLAEAGVLIVGSGQSGVQLAEEIHASGRPVTLACGRAPWLPRRAGGRDIVTWLERTSYFEKTLADLPDPTWRLAPNAQLTGARGGHDLHLRTLQRQGVTLAGRLTGVRDGHATFADDLSESVDFGDRWYADVRRLLATELGPDAPALPVPEPFHAEPRTELDLAGVATVIFTCGFRPDHARWIEFPVFDELGFPVVDDDLATSVPGLFFCGVHLLRNRRSSLMWGVGADAAIVAETLARRR